MDGPSLSLSTGCIYFLLHYPFLLKYTQEPIFPRKNLSPQKKKYSRGPKGGWLFIGKLRVWPSSDTLGFNGGRKEKRVKKKLNSFQKQIFGALFNQRMKVLLFFCSSGSYFSIKKAAALLLFAFSPVTTHTHKKLPLTVLLFFSFQWFRKEYIS